MKKVSLLVLFAGLLLSACASKNIEENAMQNYRGQNADQIFKSAEAALASGNYARAAKDFEALDTIFPYTQYSRQAELDILQAYYLNGDTASTVASADRFIHLYPRDPSIDYAYYMKGLANFNQYRGFAARVFHLDIAKRDLQGAKQAFRDFEMLVSLYPDSRYARDARAHMIFLRNMFGTHALQVAEFYMQRRAYVAALNRASEVIQHYSQTPAAAEALAIMVRANRLLHRDGPANDALRVLKANYPHAVVLRELER